MQRRKGRNAMVEPLEERRLLSGTVTGIAQFNGANGFSPVAVVEDAHGNLFGVTLFVQNGQNVQSGEVFEVAAGTGTINVLGTFSSAGGLISPASLIVDSNGNVFGTANGGPSNGGSFVFEVAAGTSTITTLAPFPAQSNSMGLGSQGTLTAVDSAGNLFGYDNLGNAIEVVAGSGAVSTIANIYGNSGSGESLIDLRLGPDGNLYGATQNEVLQINTTTHVVTTLATLDLSTLGNIGQGIAVDSAGDVWGFEQSGSTGPNIGGGSVWELPAGTSMVTLVSNFTAATGYNPVCRPVFGANGNLYGITENGGANGDGSLFEIPAGASASAPASPTDLFDLDSSEQTPDAGCGIIANGAGVVTGITSAGTDVPFYGALFGGVPISTNEIHPDLSGGFGELADLLVGRSLSPEDLKQKIAKDKAVIDRLVQAVKNGQPTPPDLLSQHLIAAVASPDLLLAPQKLSAKQLAPINKQIATARHNLATDTVLVNKWSTAGTQYARESKLVTSLEAQLAKAKSTAPIQKRLNAAEALQTKYLNQQTAAYTTALNALDNLDTLFSTIVTDYNALLA